MTALHAIYVASIAGAILFFAAGAAAMSLRSARRRPITDEIVRQLTVRAERAEVALRERTDIDVRGHVRVEAALRERTDIDVRGHERAEAVLHERAQINMRVLAERAERAESTAREQHRRAERAETTAREQQRRTEQVEAARREQQHRAEQAETIAREQQRRAEQFDDELKRMRADAIGVRAEAERMRAEAIGIRAESERMRAEAIDSTATAERMRAEAIGIRAESERMRGEAIGIGGDVERTAARLQEIEQQLAERAQTVRDLATDNEQLKGRLRDAEGLRAEYVRLRTATVESEYLKSEIARLEREVRGLRVEALGAQRPALRPARVTGVQVTATAGPRTISESLVGVLELFVDTGTRSVAVADLIGFPLAGTGDDAHALAAYATLLVDAAMRADQFVPFARPVSIEVIDERGVRLSLWPFDAGGDRLLLANLAVTPVDPKRIDSTLTALAKVLEPSAIAS